MSYTFCDKHLDCKVMSNAIRLDDMETLNLNEEQLAQLDAFADTLNSGPQDTLSEALSKVMAVVGQQ